jgi:hypothetical protein
MAEEVYNWNMRAKVLKYDGELVRNFVATHGFEPKQADFEAYGILPTDEVEIDGNGLLNGGKQRISDLITGTGSPQAFNLARGVAGVGNGTGGFSAAHTSLQGASQYYLGLDAAPTSVTGVITASATFGAGIAEFTWEEWGWAIATAAPVPNASFATATTSGVMLNRKLQTLGGKSGGAVWVLQATATQS